MPAPTARTKSVTWLRREPTEGTHPLWLIVLASVWMASLGNLALWQELLQMPELALARTLALSLGFSLVIAAVLAAVISLLAWRWTLKPVLLVLLLIAAASTHFMLNYHIVIDSTMLLNVAQSNWVEARDLLNTRLLLGVLVLALLPGLWLLRRPVQRLSLLRQALGNGIFFIAACGLAVGLGWWMFQDLSSLMRNRTELRFMVNPLNTVYALGELALKRKAGGKHMAQPIGLDARLGPSYAAQARPPLLLLVVGETARSANFSLNGYGRLTNPQLTRDDVTSFRQVQACGTSTASALPCMFSHLGREAFEARQANYQNLLDVLQRAGLAVLWIDNQAGCKGLCERVHHASTAKSTAAGLCTGGECLDEVMLQGLEERIQALPPEQSQHGVVVVMHTMGSHGPAYYRRSPAAFKPFSPECTTPLLQECSQQQVVNAYDNSIVYTDHVLHSAVRWLRSQDAQYSASLIYLSDHGESLGENKLYLHGLPYAIAPDVQKRVPLITWLSAQQQQRSRTRSACLKKRLNEPLTHDYLFHSVLGLMDVRTDLYRKELDWFAPCVGR
jgi:lipid A ethanolaminephosphotransferase